MLLITLWCATRGWHDGLLDRHEFRQLQTALTTHWMQTTGWQLDYATPLFGPPWSVPMEFPVYQLIVAQVSTLLGTGIEPTARGVSLFFFLALLPALHALTRLVTSTRAHRLLIVAAVLASPTYLFYARAFMIETTALCFSVWFLLGSARTAQQADWRWAALSTLAGGLAALAKTTTFLIFCPPAATLVFWIWRQQGRPFQERLRPALLTAIPVVLSLALGLLWVRHADAVKHSNPFTGFLSSAELAKWNWGTFGQRISPEFWREFWHNFSGFVLGEIPLAAGLVAFTLAGPSHRRAALWCIGSFLAGLLLFSNLFYHHDYYYCANAVFLLAGAGILLAGAWVNERIPRVTRGLLLVLFFVGQLFVYERGYASYHRRELPSPPVIATAIRHTLPADDVILIYGWDWNATLPYYAGRRAVMVPQGREHEITVLETILERLPPHRISAMVVRSDTLNRDPAFIRWRTDRFHLTPAPVATSEGGDLYLREDLLSSAAALPPDLPGLTLQWNPPAAFPATTPVATETLQLAIFSPAPLIGHTQYGMMAGELGGHPILQAHAPSELIFTPPAGARTLVAEYGLPDAAHTGGPAVTDGIGVEIIELMADGRRRTLYRRTLDPANQPADRGPQHVTLEEARPFTGELLFRFTTGPAGNAVNDWAYWGGITIR